MSKTFSIIILFLIALISCKKNNDFPSEKLFLNELKFVTNKSQNTLTEIKTLSDKYPERYTKSRNHALDITSRIKSLDSLIQIRNFNDYKLNFKEFKKVISQYKSYRGYWIFELIQKRYTVLERPEINQTALRWNLLNLEYELLNYVFKSLNNDYMIFTSAWPIVKNDSLIFLASTDSTLIHKIHIWDLKKSERLFYENPDDTSVVEIKIEKGIAKLTKNQLLKFKEGYQGFYKIETQRGDINNYWFSNK